MQPTLNPIDLTSGLSANRMSQRRVRHSDGDTGTRREMVIQARSPPRLPTLPVHSPGLCSENLQP